MKLSTQTLNILKNYSKINRTIVLREGNFLVVKSSDSSVVSFITLDDTFEQDSCIFDINEFLAVMAMLDDDAELTFNHTNINIRKDNVNVTYNLASQYILNDFLQTLPAKKANIQDEPTFRYELSAEELVGIVKAAGLLSLDTLQFNKNGITLNSTRSTSTSNLYELKLNSNSNSDNVHSISVEHLHLIKTAYVVEVFSDKNVARFIAQNGTDLEYFIMFKNE